MKTFLVLNARPITDDPKALTYEAEEDLMIVHLERRLIKLFLSIGIHVDKLWFKGHLKGGEYGKINSMTLLRDLKYNKLVVKHPEVNKKNKRMVIPRPAVATIREETPCAIICGKCDQGYAEEPATCNVCLNKLDIDW